MRKGFFCVALLAACVLMLTGCEGNALPQAPEPTPTEAITASLTQLPTLKPTPEPTDTPKPTESPTPTPEPVYVQTIPENAQVKQHQALLATEGIDLEFTDDAIDEIADLSCRMNEQNEDIGARRLATVLEKLLEDISYEIPEPDESGKIVIDKDFVMDKFADTIRRDDMDRYII